MLKDLRRLAELFCQFYWLQSLLWIFLQILLISLFRIFSIGGVLNRELFQERSMIVIFVLAGGISLSYAILLLFLGYVFCRGRSTNWVGTLPFRGLSLYLFPVTIILCNWPAFGGQLLNLKTLVSPR